MEEILKGLPGVEVIMDDILIHGVDDADHDAKLAKVLSRIKESGLKLNEGKCLFRQSELQYMGHTVGKDGIRPDPGKVKAILDLKPPTNVTEVRQLLGMVNYLGRFLQNLSQVNRAWLWDAAEEEAFSKVKEMITTTPVLAFYEFGKPTIVSADARSHHHATA
jgi:hypothetical protein